MAQHVTHHHEEATGWVGWIGFAAAMLGLVGIFHMLAGFVALFQNDAYFLSNGAVWLFDSSQWGWIHIGGGLLALLAAGSLLRGNMFGRTVAVIVATLSAFANMAFMPIYPLWSIVILAIDVLVIYAVIAHGREMQYDEEM
jgi:hypothetical protein